MFVGFYTVNFLIDHAEYTHQNISVKLANLAQSLQDKIELEFKGQMVASKEELVYLQKEMIDKIKLDMK